MNALKAATVALVEPVSPLPTLAPARPLLVGHVLGPGLHGTPHDGVDHLRLAIGRAEHNAGVRPIDLDGG